MSGVKSIGRLVREHAAASMRYAAALAKSMGLEVSELMALEHLQAAGPMTLRRLGERLSMSPGAVTALVDRLEARGYVVRVPNPEDRRSALVCLAEAGVYAPLEHLRPYVQEMRGLESGLSDEEREAVARFLREATEAAHRHARRLRDRRG